MALYRKVEAGIQGLLRGGDVDVQSSRHRLTIEPWAGVKGS